MGRTNKKQKEQTLKMQTASKKLLDAVKRSFTRLLRSTPSQVASQQSPCLFPPVNSV